MQSRNISDIITMLKSNDPNQTLLTLKGVTFSQQEQFIEFCNALVNNRTITTLEFAGCNVDNIRTLEPLFIAIAHHKKISYLNFSEWPIIRKYLDMLSDALSNPFGKSVVEVNLSNCQITDNNISKFNCLTYNRSIRKITLSHNFINTSGAISLAKQFKYIPHIDRSLLAIDKEQTPYRDFSDITAQFNFTAKNISLVDLDLSHNTAVRSKYFIWEDVLKNINTTLLKNRIEMNKRHPIPKVHIPSETFVSDELSSPEQQNDPDVTIFFDFYIMKQFTSEISRLENAYVFIQESAELFFIIDGEIDKVKIHDIDKFKQLLSDIFLKSPHKRLTNQQIHTLLAPNTSYTLEANPKAAPDAERRVTIDVNQLILPKNLSHLPSHMLVKSTQHPSRPAVATTDTSPDTPLCPDIHELSRGNQISLLGFMTGAGGLGLGVMIAVGLLLTGVIAGSLIGLATLGAIALACCIGGAVIGSIVGALTATEPKNIPTEPIAIDAPIKTTTSSLSKVMPTVSRLSIDSTEDNTVPLLDKMDKVSTSKFGGLLSFTEEDLRKTKAHRERKIAAHTLIASNIQ